MRKFTNKMELVRHGVTRFATTFLTLQRLFKQKHNLRRMFTSEEWLKSKSAKEVKGKRASDIVLLASFWNDVQYCIMVMGPLVNVLRLVDNEKKPAMGYIYEAMDRVKETIQQVFKEKEVLYRDVFSIIDRRWESQLHHPLHAAGHFLNPEFYYSNKSMEFDEEVMQGLYKCIERLVTNEEEADKIISELSYYKRAERVFGSKFAIKHRKTLAPAEWWRNYGSSTPALQKFAIKVLSLTCSSSGCERNWSTFEHIHSKKRSKLGHQKLQDLVYVKYNQNLKERFDCRDVIDPIVLRDVDECNEWLVGQMDKEGAEDELVFDDDNGLTWGDVSIAVGASEPLQNTRLATRSKRPTPIIATKTSKSSRKKGKEPMQDQEEEYFDDEEEETKSDENEGQYEEIFKSSSNGGESDEENLVVGDDYDDDDISLSHTLMGKNVFSFYLL